MVVPNLSKGVSTFAEEGCFFVLRLMMNFADLYKKIIYYMRKRILRFLRRYAHIADYISRVVVFLHNNQEIIQALQDMSFMEIIACTLYGGYLVYQWKILLSECFPRIYYILKKAASLMFVDLALSI